MTNREKFKEVFGLYAAELWAMPEIEFLNWLNSEYDVAIVWGRKTLQNNEENLQGRLEEIFNELRR